MHTQKQMLFLERFDLLRYPLIVLVVLIHADNREVWMAGNCIPIELHGFLSLWSREFISQVLARVAVPLFFAISGYLFFYRYDGSVKEMLRKWKGRLQSLVLPFLVWGTLHFALLCYAKGCAVLRPGILDVLDMILGVTRAPLVYHLWFIRDLIVYVIAAPLIYLVIRKHWWLGLLFCGYVYFFHAWFFPRPSPEGLFYFTLGSVLGLRAWKGTVIDRFRWLWLGGYAGIALLDSFDVGHVWSEALHQFGMVIGCGAFLALAGIIVNAYPKLRSSLTYFASASFFLYAAHEPVLRNVRSWIFWRMPKGFDPGGVLLYWVPSVLVIALFTVLYFAVVRKFTWLRKGLAGGR